LKPYLLVMTIGPVQSFVDASRKARDMWYSSELLSKLAEAAARCALEQGASLIFPPSPLVQKQPMAQPMGVPNKLEVFIPAGSDPEAVARACQKSVWDALDEEWKHVKDHLEKRLASSTQLHSLRHSGPNAVAWEEGLRQIHTYFEWFASWTPYDENDYAGARKQAHMLLAAAKTARAFQPAPQLAGRERSSLDPSLLSIAPDLATWNHEVEPGEQLDGVGLLKRFGSVRRTVTLGRVAIEPYLQRASRNASAFSRIRELAERLAQQGNAQKAPLLVRLSPEAFPMYVSFPYSGDIFQIDETEEDYSLVKPIQDALWEACQVRGRPRAASHVAILMADGDHIGAFLDKLSTPSHVERFSSVELQFARQARDTVAHHGGVVVYTGGDDVLAFLPFSEAIGAAHELSERFQALLEEAFPTVEREKRPTLSVGIAAGYFRHPLTAMMRWARSSEAYSKVYRNALTFSWHIGGAEEGLRVRHDWTEKPWERWRTVIELYRNKEIPHATAYEVRRLLLDRERGLPAAVVPDELWRILRRRQADHGRPVGVDTVQRLLWALSLDHKAWLCDEEEAWQRVRQAADMLRIAQEMVPVVDR
jgi:CRISPR-associated protein Cmr2